MRFRILEAGICSDQGRFLVELRDVMMMVDMIVLLEKKIM
jgi:hypothetical protein